MSCAQELIESEDEECIQWVSNVENCNEILHRCVTLLVIKLDWPVVINRMCLLFVVWVVCEGEQQIPKTLKMGFTFNIHPCD